MASVSIYLSFSGEAEEAFNFYKTVFGTEFLDQGIMRFREIPPSDEMSGLPESDLDLVMHVTLPITGGFLLMGSDAPESMGYKVISGSNMYINLQPDTRSETRQLFIALAQGGSVEHELQDMFWGDYYGSLTDKFGIKWMFNCAEAE
jgi:PhnB protein